MTSIKYETLIIYIYVVSRKNLMAIFPILFGRLVKTPLRWVGGCETWGRPQPAHYVARARTIIVLLIIWRWISFRFLWWNKYTCVRVSDLDITLRKLMNKTTQVLIRSTQNINITIIQRQVRKNQASQQVRKTFTSNYIISKVQKSSRSRPSD